MESLRAIVVALALFPCCPHASAGQAVEPQPLPAGVADSGVNILLDSSHQFSFFHHWQVQDALRDAGHRVTGNQDSLHRALVPGTLVRVRDQSSHAWNTQRAFTRVPVPAFDVVLLYQHSVAQPYLPAERDALEAFVSAGGGLVIDASAADSPLARLVETFGATLQPGLSDVAPLPGLSITGIDVASWTGPRRTAGVTAEWRTFVGAGAMRASVATRAFGKGVVVLFADPQSLRVRVDGKEHPNRALLSWAIKLAARNATAKRDARRVPWEPAGLGGAIYPEHQIDVGGVRVLYADNQLPGTIALAKTRFPEVLALLQQMLPTPPNPGEAYYINLAAGEGGGWAENAVTPKLAGTIAIAPETILSVLAHELAHTMYGPEATDGTPGCRLPAWWSEAHAGWFQRKVIRELGYGDRWPFWPKGLASLDPTLGAVDLAAVKDDQMRLAWEKAWMIWSVLDARYGPAWYPQWLSHVHGTYRDPSRQLTMDEYVRSVSESVGEDVAALFERFGTSVGSAGRAKVPPMAPRK